MITKGDGVIDRKVILLFTIAITLFSTVFDYFGDITNPLGIPKGNEFKKISITKGKFQNIPTVLGIYRINTSIEDAFNSYKNELIRRQMKIVSDFYSEKFSTIVAKGNNEVIGVILLDFEGEKILYSQKMSCSENDIKRMFQEGKFLEELPIPASCKSVFYNEQTDVYTTTKMAIYKSGSPASYIINYYKSELKYEKWNIADMPSSDGYGILISKGNKEGIIFTKENGIETEIILQLIENGK